jgi:hypothetical protein
MHYRAIRAPSSPVIAARERLVTLAAQGLMVLMRSAPWEAHAGSQTGRTLAPGGMMTGGLMTAGAVMSLVRTRR